MNAKPKFSGIDLKVDFNGPYRMLIGGKLVDSNERFEVYNPATGDLVAMAPSGSREQMEQAIAAAKEAQPKWAGLSWDERAAYIAAFADALEANKEDLITLLTTEQGKPRHSMASFEVNYGLDWLREIATRRLTDEVIEDTDQHLVKVSHTPLGVVGAITPWNFPNLLSVWKIAACLLTGNTMVMKPSPYTPLGALRIGEIAVKVFPTGVLNIISGGNEQGAWMTEHKDIDKISFTGSTATGKKVMASSSSNLKRITLELGGNDPAIVLPGTDYKQIIPDLFNAAFGNSGQWCIAVKRLYVHSSQHADFVRDFVDHCKTKKVGDGMDADTDLGPIQNRMQFGKLQALFADVKDKGYKVEMGGTIDENQKSNFVPITIVNNPPDDSRIVREEPFGPILPILSYDDVDEVIERANDTDFGLGAYVMGPDVGAADKVAERIEAGTVWVNQFQSHGVDIPFGGHKQSGMGVENGRAGLEAFCNSKTYINKKK